MNYDKAQENSHLNDKYFNNLLRSLYDLRNS